MRKSDHDLSTEFISSALLYRLAEKEDVIPLVVANSSFEFAEKAIAQLNSYGAIEANNEENCWDVTEKGIQLFDQMLDSYDALIDLQVFATVNLSIDLEDNLFDEEGHVMDGELDPRFEEPADDDEAEALGTTDLRLPIMDFFAERASAKLSLAYGPKLRNETLSRVVFLQELGNDRFADDKAFFTDLKIGALGAEIKEIVDSVPPWLELAREFDPPAKLMEVIIEGGFRDAKKREMLIDDLESVWFDPDKQSKVMDQMLTSFISVV